MAGWRCPFCKREAVFRELRLTEEKHGQLVVIEHVPAWVCEQCGEQYFDPGVADKVNRILWSMKPTHTIEVPVYDFVETVPA